MLLRGPSKHTRTCGNYQKTDQQLEIQLTEQFHPDAPQQLLGEANFTGAIRNYRDEEIDKRQAAAAP